MVHRAMKTPEGNLFLIIMGVARVRIDEFVSSNRIFERKIRPVPGRKGR